MFYQLSNFQIRSDQKVIAKWTLAALLICATFAARTTSAEPAEGSPTGPLVDVQVPELPIEKTLQDIPLRSRLPQQKNFRWPAKGDQREKTLRVRIHQGPAPVDQVTKAQRD